MKETYNSDELYSAIKNKLYVLDESRSGAFKSTTSAVGADHHIVVISNDEGTYDIRHPEVNLDLVNQKGGNFIVHNLKPLYDEPVHKVVTARQAYFHLFKKRIKKVVCK
jgi:hypothetical protein